jgi:hypothetical protein
VIAAIHQPHYIPWLRYVHKIASCDVFVLLDDAQFNKNGWQNRNWVKGPQGPILLTVPVRDSSFKPINQVEINPQAAWKEKHWKTLALHYGKAPYFRTYAESFEEIYRSNWSHLAELNLRIVRTVVDALGLRTTLVRSSELGVPGQGTGRLVEICRRVGATQYLSGAYAASNHFDADAFGEAGIEVRVQTWQCPQYSQLYPSAGFLPNLSAVDLLFNEGPRSLSLLLQQSREQVPA